MSLMTLANRVGFSTNIYDNPSHISETVSLLGNNFSVIEIEFEKEIRHQIDNNESYWLKECQILNTLKMDKNLYYSVHGPYIGLETDISNSDEFLRKIAVDYMKKYIMRASEIGASLFTLHPGYIEFDENGMSVFHFESLTKSLKELVTFSQEYGIQVLLENTGKDRDKYIVLSDEQHAELCKEIGVKLTIDLVHFHSFYFHLSTEEYLSKLKSLIPNVSNAHFNDILNGEHIHLPLRKGNFNYDHILKFMSEHGFQGNFILEESGGGYSPESFLDAGTQYIKELECA